MHRDILLCRTVYIRQLFLCQPQILIGKTHGHTGYLIIVLIEYYFVFLVHNLIRKSSISIAKVVN